MDNQWINDISKNLILKVGDITKVWEAIGVCNEKYITRSNRIKDHIYNMLDTMLTEEQEHKLDLEKNIKDLTAEIQLLCSELKTIYEFPSKISLLKNESILIEKREELVLIKESRIQRLYTLIRAEQTICEKLYEYATILNTNIVPTEFDLETFENRVKSLQHIEIDRRAAFNSKRTKIIDLYDRLLDKPTPKDAFVDKIINDTSGEEVPLSLDFLSQCDRLIKQLLDELERNKEECIILRNRYFTLFNILSSSQTELSYSSCAMKDSNDFTCKTLNMLRCDVSILEKCRLDKMGEFIKNYQNKIQQIMKLNFLSHFQDIEPYRSHLKSEDTSEELLEILERHLDNFTEIEKQVAPIVKEFENWKICFSKLNELKMKLKDPVVLKNRGGILLKVEKEKNSVQKELPKSELRLSNLLSSLKSDIIGPEDLLIADMRILDYLLYQWNHNDGDKENEKKPSIKPNSTNTSIQKSVNIPKKAPLIKANNNISQTNETTPVKVQILQNKVQSVNEFMAQPIANAIHKSVSPIPKLTYQSIKIQSVREPGFRIPKLTKIPQKKIIKTISLGINKRMSRSCSNLNEMQPKKTGAMGSNANLYKDFYSPLIPGFHTSSFIENVPVQRQ